MSGAWGCEMSWMTPSYIRIQDPIGPSSRYSLYLYREQGWDIDEQVCPQVIYNVEKGYSLTPSPQVIPSSSSRAMLDRTSKYAQLRRPRLGSIMTHRERDRLVSARTLG